MGEMTSEELDEGVDAGTDSSFDETNTNAPRPPTPPIPRPPSSTDSLGTCLDALVPEASALLASLISSQDETESWDDQHMARLRAQVILTFYSDTFKKIKCSNYIKINLRF